MITDETWEKVAADLDVSVDRLMEMIAELDKGRDAHGADSPIHVIVYRDRDGDPLTLGQWAFLYESQTYKTVNSTTLPSGIWVATVWTGMGENFPDSATAFKSAVFTRLPPEPPEVGDWEPLDIEEYETEPEARAGHEKLVAKWSVAR